MNGRAPFPGHLRNPNAEHARGFPTGACWVIVRPVNFGVVFALIFSTPRNLLIYHIAMFPTERELVSRFKELSQPFLREVCHRTIHRYFVLDEFNCLDGVADIVLGTFKPSYRFGGKRNPIPLDWVYPLQKISCLEKVSASEFAELFLVSEATARKCIREYAEAKFLKKIGNEDFKVCKPYKSALDFVVAIEAKIKNWNHALSQAYRYKKFSDLTFVLLDETYSNSAKKNLDSFEKYNIGLITMNSEG